MAVGIQRVLPALMAGFLIGLCGGVQAESRLYQWTDAQGRVQYSDKAPDGSPAASTSNLATQPQLPAVRTFPPVALPPGKLAPLAVAQPDYSALQNAVNLGRLYVAADCINPSEIGWTELMGPGSIFMDGNRKFLAESAARTLRDLGYDAKATVFDSEWSEIATAGGLRLVPVITAVDARVCLPRHTGNQVRRDDIPRLVQVSGERAGIWMQVRWELWRKGGRFPLKIFETEGASLQWNGNSSLWLVAHEAIRVSARNLAGYPGLGKALREQSANPVVISAAPPAKKEESFSLSGLVDGMQARFRLQPKVAQAMGLISPLKPIIVESYMESGRWPVDLQALLPAGTQLNEPGLIEKVTMGQEGEIVVTFASEVQAGAWLKLKPRDNHINVQWSCSSNLPAQALGGENGFCKSTAN
ncbi:MAG: pilin [Pedobacter sp.]|nr:pilin [Pedobacter sp.]